MNTHYNTPVHFFKVTGKWYETELVAIPLKTHPWEVRKVIETYLSGRLRGMTAVITDEKALDALWGFPILLSNIGSGVPGVREGGP